jgi:hypothetical protein
MDIRYKEMVENGVDGFWNGIFDLMYYVIILLKFDILDMNEPTIFAKTESM